jgi:hypothetical protein
MKSIGFSDRFPRRLTYHIYKIMAGFLFMEFFYLVCLCLEHKV